MNMKTGVPPVLLLAFNRPDQAVIVLERIKIVRPPALYVAVDGPRPGREDDVQNVQAVRRLIEGITWCKVKTLYRDRNLGCGRAVSEGITWFLADVSEGIILEDDCLPDVSFFLFCGQMLERYRETCNVMQISGYNLLGDTYQSKYDYFFSSFGWQWGWATWKRAWDYFDLTMASWPELRNSGYQNFHPFYPLRIKVFDKTYRGAIDTWDYQWHYAMATQSGISVVPRCNLVENFGIGAPGATHGKDPSSRKRYQVPIHPMPAVVKSCPFVVPDRAYDELLIRVAHRCSWSSYLYGVASALVNRRQKQRDR